MSTVDKPLINSKSQQKNRLFLSFLRKKIKYIIVIIIIICFLLNEKILQLYQRQNFRITNIYYQENMADIDESVTITTVSQLNISKNNTNHSKSTSPDTVEETMTHLQTEPALIERPDVATDMPFVLSEKIYQNYSDEHLVEWEPAPKQPSNSSEPGYLGTAPIVPKGFEKIAEDTFEMYQMNLVASNMLSHNRTLNDSRFPECFQKLYPEKLPQTTVVINFNNEASSTLLRTIWSVYTKSPRALLKEIILVDDHSSLSHLGQKLDDYIKTVPVPIRILRLKERAGTTLTKQLAVKLVTTPVITFLDAHVECNDGWLEPLLARVAQNRRAAVTPIIDYISPQTFALKNYNDMDNMYGTFDWNLYYVWGKIPQRERDRNNGDRTAFINTPEFAGGIFAIDKEFYSDIGEFDGKMVYYGAENVEMSLRVWMCGGSIETIPCSRVGHLGRISKPYTLPHGLYHSMMLNSVRVVDVWLDEYKTTYYAIHPEAIEMRSDVTERIELRNRLQCKSFQWYLDNVYPESTLAQKYIDIGLFESFSQKNNCIDAYPSLDKVSVKPCRIGYGQALMLSEKGEIRYDEQCLEATGLGKPMYFNPCNETHKEQQFAYNSEANTINQDTGSNCLTVMENKFLTAMPCNGSLTQKWVLNSNMPIAEEIS